MGQSTNAILFYGYCWDEEASSPWTIDSDNDGDTDEDDWEMRYARGEGCVPPTEKFPERLAPDGYSIPTDYTAAEQKIIKAHKAYWKKKDEIVATSPCEVATHGSGECPMPYVAVIASLTLAHRGYPEEISSLIIDPSWDAQITAFCEKIGISVEGQRLGWWLVSDWN